VGVINGWLTVTHLLGIGTAPTVATAGGSTAATVTGASDTAHNVAVTTAASVSAGVTVASVTFNLSFNTTGRGPSKLPRFALTAKNAATVSAGCYITGDTYTGYSIAVANALVSATSLSLDVHVIGS
jgi:hypothetical protein